MTSLDQHISSSPSPKARSNACDPKATSSTAAIDLRRRAVAGIQKRPSSQLRPLLVTVSQAAELLSVGRTTIYELMWRGELTPVRIGRSVRFAVEQLEQFVGRHIGRN